MMNRLEVSIDIQADRAKIWKTLWDDASYREWTSVFFEGSHAISQDWQEGSKVLFLTPEQNGMYAIIERHIPEEIMAFKHIGNVVKGKEQPIDEETRKWTGTMEIYRLTEGVDANTLIVEIDVFEGQQDSTKTVFLKALERVKQLAEAQTTATNSQ